MHLKKICRSTDHIWMTSPWPEVKNTDKDIKFIPRPNNIFIFIFINIDLLKGKFLKISYESKPGSSEG
jgi:hypothetical protein